jgi:hypothetical protein
MTDPNVPPPPADPVADSATPAAPAAGKKSPLDVLEDILNESKGADGEAGKDPAAAAAELAADAAKAEAEALAKVQADTEQQRLIDEAKLKEQIAGLGTLKDTPAYQARVSQDAEKQADAAQAAAAGQGYDIVQLDHTKV